MAFGRRHPPPHSPMPSVPRAHVRAASMGGSRSRGTVQVRRRIVDRRSETSPRRRLSIALQLSSDARYALAPSTDGVGGEVPHDFGYWGRFDKESTIEDRRHRVLSTRSVDRTTAVVRCPRCDRAFDGGLGGRCAARFWELGPVRRRIVDRRSEASRFLDEEAVRKPRRLVDRRARVRLLGACAPRRRPRARAARRACRRRCCARSAWAGGRRRRGAGGFAPAGRPTDVGQRARGVIAPLTEPLASGPAPRELRSVRVSSSLREVAMSWGAT